MDQSDDVIAHMGAAARAARADARTLREESAALQGEARQRRRQAHVRNIVRRARQLHRELDDLDAALAAWDGIHPPPQHLIERIETVEAGLDTTEAQLQALRLPA